MGRDTLRTCDILTPEIVAEVRRRLAAGEYQHKIAADLGINQGRISEVNTGKRG